MRLRIADMEVHHYGPNKVSDPDHSTYIRVVDTNGENNYIQLYDDEDIVKLIELLQTELRVSDAKCTTCDDLGMVGSNHMNSSNCPDCNREI